MTSLFRFRCCFLLVALALFCVAEAAINRTDVSRVTQGGNRRNTVAPSTAPRVRVILDHGQQSGSEDSSFSASRQSSFSESRAVQAQQKRLLNNLVNSGKWDPELMKISDEEVATAKRSDSSCTLTRELEEQLNRTDYTHYEDGVRVELAPALVEQIKKYLACMGTCPITYTWENLGDAFFPRFIRRGFCSNDRPCSWPPGMRCKVSGSKAIAIYQKKCEGDTAISLVNSNGTRVLDNRGSLDKRRLSDLRSARPNNGAGQSGTRSASATDQRRNKVEEGRKKRLKGANQPENKQNNKKGNKKKEQNQRGKNETLRGTSEL